MLVITYTSDHNHPWPTQRNALAGSTRSQPSKVNFPKSPPLQPHPTPLAAAAAPPSEAGGRKEEESPGDAAGEGEFGEGGIPYRPAPHDSDRSEDLLFADLEEIEGGDPMSLLLPREFGGGGGKDGKPLDIDPFDLYDWTAGNSSSFGDGKRSPGL